MTTIKIASWNVNSVNARLENVLFWLKTQNPDVVLLQEIKCEEVNFPSLIIRELGYDVLIHGQKSYNGVAILSKFPIKEVARNLDPNDPQSRYIEAIIETCGLDAKPYKIRVASIYVPNGGSELLMNQKVNETDKFIYKMKFFDQLKHKITDSQKLNEITILGGDYNVALDDIDVYDPKGLKNTVCFHDDERKKMREILNLGYQDSFRMTNPNSQSFSWWDYRGNSFAYNKGMRIDYLLVSPKAADLLKKSYIDENMMKREKPSDHSPVVIEIDLAS